MDCCSAHADVLIGKAGDSIRTLQNISGLMIQIIRDAKAKNGYSTTTNADMHDANAASVSSSGGHTSDAAIYLVLCVMYCWPGIEHDLLNFATSTDYPFVQSEHAGLPPSLVMCYMKLLLFRKLILNVFSSGAIYVITTCAPMKING